MQRFYDSVACSSRLNCETCRELSPRGEQFRDTMKKAFNLTDDSFPCVENKEFVTPEKGTEQEKVRLPSIVESQRNRKELDICRACEDSTKQKVFGFEIVFCGTPFVSGNGTCGCVMNVKSRLPGTKCPKGKW